MPFTFFSSGSSSSYHFFLIGLFILFFSKSYNIPQDTNIEDNTPAIIPNKRAKLKFIISWEPSIINVITGRSVVRVVIIERVNVAFNPSLITLSNSSLFFSFFLLTKNNINYIINMVESRLWYESR